MNDFEKLNENFENQSDDLNQENELYQPEEIENQDECPDITSEFEQTEDAEPESFQPEYTYDCFYIEKEPKNTKKHKTNVAIIALSSALVACLTVCTAFGVSLFWKQNKNTNGSVYHSSNVAVNKSDDKTENTQFKPTGKELTTTEIAAKVGPTVVGVVCSTRTINFFNQMSEAESSGSGVIISEDGYIVTNNHVIESANKVKIVLNSGDEYEAKVIGSDSRSDIAVLKIDAKKLPYASIGDSSVVMVGDKAVAIGNPLGTELMGTVTQGIISAVNRTVTIDNKKLTLLQTDAAINSGNSGGALVNAYGEVIGINSVKMSAAGVEGIGFAIPSNVFKPIIDDLISAGYVKGRLMIGVAGTNITETLSKYYELPEGFYVNQVYEGYGAYLAGIEPGDVIIKCDGKVTKTIDDINAIRDKHKVGEMMTITVSRNGKNMDFKVKLMEENPGRNLKQ